VKQDDDKEQKKKKKRRSPPPLTYKENRTDRIVLLTSLALKGEREVVH